MSTPRTLQLPDATIAYDVLEPEAPSEHPPVLMIGQPMTADGFGALAEQMRERTVVLYDPRGLGRSTRSDGSTTNDPTQQAEDLHALITELGGGPVDVFASSGGAVTALALVQAHPRDVRVLVAHEPPLTSVLPDRDEAVQAESDVQAAYHRSGFGAGMAEFIKLISWQGEFNDDYFAQDDADPANFGLPTDDDGSRDDVLLGGDSGPVTAFTPDTDALQDAATRVVLAAGLDSGQIMPARSAAVLADRLGTDVVMFRGGHGGFMADEWGQPGNPAEFADQLRAQLDT